MTRPWWPLALGLVLGALLANLASDADLEACSATAEIAAARHWACEVELAECEAGVQP